MIEPWIARQANCQGQVFFSSYSSKMATDHDDMMKNTKEDEEAGLKSASDDRTNDLD